MTIKAATLSVEAGTLRHDETGAFSRARRTRAWTSGLAILLSLAGSSPVHGQQRVQEPSPPSKPLPQTPKLETAKPASIGVPSPQNLFIMIRTTLVALHQANVTGNYSVLHDLGAPDFQQANSVERLSAAFAELRTHGGDIASVVLAMPTLARPPAVDQNGMLRLTGSFDTKPNQLDFDMAFQSVGGFWRLDAIGVKFRSPLPAKAAGDAPDSKNAPAAAPKKGAKVKR